MDETSEIIDRAMDAAEEKISEATAKEPESAPESSSDETEEIITAKAIADKKPSKKAAKEPEAEEEEPAEEEAETAPSDETEIIDQATEEEEVEAEPTEESEALQIEAPTFWSAEHKNVFAKLPSEAKQAIAQYEQQRNAYTSRIVGEAKRGMELEKSLNEVFEPQRARLQAQGCRDIVDAATRLLAWDETFTADPMTGIADLMRKNNISPYDFLNGDGNNRYQTDPQVEEARREAAAAKEAAESLKARIEAQEKQQMLAQINAFKEGKDKYGQPRRAFATMYAPQIDRVFQEIQQRDPNVPFEAALNSAYEYVLDQVRSTFGITAPTKPQPTAKTPEKVVADTKKAQAAAGSVKGAPSSGVSTSRPRLKGKNFNQKLDNAMDEAEALMGAN